MLSSSSIMRIFGLFIAFSSFAYRLRNSASNLACDFCQVCALGLISIPRGLQLRSGNLRAAVSGDFGAAFHLIPNSTNQHLGTTLIRAREDGECLTIGQAARR